MRNKITLQHLIAVDILFDRIMYIQFFSLNAKKICLVTFWLKKTYAYARTQSHVKMYLIRLLSLALISSDRDQHLKQFNRDIFFSLLICTQILHWQLL